MIAPFAVADFLVIPYRPFEGSTSKNDAILDACVAHPDWFTLPATRDDIRLTTASHLTDPRNLVWEVWKSGAFVGIFLLGRITHTDALWHFVFFDGGIAGKITLLREFVRRCFADLGFERLSLEAPENATTLIELARRKLGFRYEGETRVPNEPDLKINRPAQWIACQGSRRERAYFDGERWHDIVLLRVLKADTCR